MKLWRAGLLDFIALINFAKHGPVACLSICCCGGAWVSVGVVVFLGEGVAEKNSGMLLVGEEIAASVDALGSGTGMTWNFAGVAFVSVSDAGFEAGLERLIPNVRSVWSMAISVSVSLSDSPSEVSILSVSL